MPQTSVISLQTLTKSIWPLQPHQHWETRWNIWWIHVQSARAHFTRKFPERSNVKPGNSMSKVIKSSFEGHIWAARPGTVRDANKQEHGWCKQFIMQHNANIAQWGATARLIRRSRAGAHGGCSPLPSSHPFRYHHHSFSAALHVHSVFHSLGYDKAHVQEQALMNCILKLITTSIWKRRRKNL